MKVYVYSHNTHHVYLPIRVRFPIELFPELIGPHRAWGLSTGGYAILGRHTEEKDYGEIWLFETWKPGFTIVTFQINDEWDENWYELQHFSRSQAVTIAGVIPRVTINEGDPVVASEYGAGTHLETTPAGQKLHLKGYERGIKNEVTLYIPSGSEVIEFNGRVTVSDQGNPNQLLYPGEAWTRIFFNGEARVYFDQSRDVTLEYLAPIPDGRAFNYSGTLDFSQELQSYPDEEMGPAGSVIDGPVHGLLMRETSDGDAQSVFDDVLPGGPGLVMPSPGFGIFPGFRSDVIPEHMQRHPVAQTPNSKETGDRFCMGSPGNECAVYPQLIRALRDACDTEAFRPQHRLDENGDQASSQSNPTIRTHNMLPSSRQPRPRDYFGKRNNGAGIPANLWGPQDGEHVALDALGKLWAITGDQNAKISMEQAGRLLAWGTEFFRIPRHVGRTISRSAVAYQVDIDPALAVDIRQATQAMVIRMLDYMDDPVKCLVQSRGDMNDPQPYNQQDWVNIPRPQISWNSVQNALWGNMAAYLFYAKIPIEDPRYADYMVEGITATLRKAFFKNQFGRWQAHWAIGQDYNTDMGAGSSRLAIMQAMPGLLWLKLKEPPQEDLDRIESLKAQVKDNSSDSLRYIQAFGG